MKIGTAHILAFFGLVLAISTAGCVAEISPDPGDEILDENIDLGQDDTANAANDSISNGAEVKAKAIPHSEDGTCSVTCGANSCSGTGTCQCINGEPYCN